LLVLLNRIFLGGWLCFEYCILWNICEGTTLILCFGKVQTDFGFQCIWSSFFFTRYQIFFTGGMALQRILVRENHLHDCLFWGHGFPRTWL